MDTEVKLNLECLVGLVIKTLSVHPCLYQSVWVWCPALAFNFLLIQQWEATMMVQVIGFLPFTWEAWTELLFFCFGLSQPWRMQHLRHESVWRFSMSSSVSLFLFLSLKLKKTSEPDLNHVLLLKVANLRRGTLFLLIKWWQCHVVYWSTIPEIWL